jgi:hypothetical protein
MIAPRRTATAIATAVLVAGAAAAPAWAADAEPRTAWPTAIELADRDWTPGDGDPVPMNRDYFDRDRKTADRGDDDDRDDGDDGDGNPISRLFEAIQNGFAGSAS